MAQSIFGQVDFRNTDMVYSTIINHVMRHGQVVMSQKGETKELTGVMTEFDSAPLVVTRKTAWKTALREFEWFLSGSTYIVDLAPSARPWWKAWANKYGRILYNYSHQFRSSPCWPNTEEYAETFDQIDFLIKAVREHPFGRRNLITTWNTGDMAQPDCKITNCHGTAIQIFGRSPDLIKCIGGPWGEVKPGAVNAPCLDMIMYQRSCDLIVGVPHNWIQYWAFLMWLAHRTGCQVGRFKWIGGSVHIYKQHYEIAWEIEAKVDLEQTPTRMIYTPTNDVFRANDFSIENIPNPVVLGKPELVV